MNLNESYERYLDGQITLREWQEILLEKADNLIKSRIKACSRRYKGEYEDLLQAGRYAVCRKAAQYDPSRSSLSSFFISYIDEEQRKECEGASQLSEHYVRNIRKLDQSVRKAGYVDSLDERLTLEEMVRISGMSPVTIRHTVDCKRRTHVALDLCEDVGSKDLTTRPDLCLEAKEQKTFLQRMIAEMSPLEQMLIENLASERPVPLRSLVRKIKNMGKGKGELKELTASALEQKLGIALRKIRNHPDFPKYVDITEYNSVIDPEQAAVPDIELVGDLV